MILLTIKHNKKEKCRQFADCNAAVRHIIMNGFTVSIIYAYSNNERAMDFYLIFKEYHL